MTNQELFDIALTNLRRQRVASITGHNCVFRGPNGAKCAIGWAIPDEMYDPVMDDRTAPMDVGEILDHPRFGKPFEAIDYKLAMQLQKAHDYCMPLADDAVEPHGSARRYAESMPQGRGMDLWEAEMKRIAALFNLNYTEPAA